MASFASPPRCCRKRIRTNPKLDVRTATSIQLGGATRRSYRFPFGSVLRPVSGEFLQDTLYFPLIFSPLVGLGARAASDISSQETP